MQYEQIEGKNISPFDNELYELIEEYIRSDYNLDESADMEINIPKDFSRFLNKLALTFEEHKNGDVEVLPYLCYEGISETSLLSFKEIQTMIDSITSVSPLTVTVTEYEKIHDARIWGDPDDCYEAEYEEHETTDKYYVSLEDILDSTGYVGISPKFKKELESFNRQYSQNNDEQQWEREE